MPNTNGHRPQSRVVSGTNQGRGARGPRAQSPAGNGLFLGVGDGLRVTPKRAFSPISVAEVLSSQPYIMTITAVERADNLELRGVRIATVPSRVLYFETTRSGEFAPGRNWISHHGATARAVEMTRGKGQSITIRPHPDADSADIRRAMETGFTVRFTGDEDDMGVPKLQVAADAPWVIKPLELVGKDWWRSPMRCWMTALEEQYATLVEMDPGADRYLAALDLENLAGDMFRERVRQADMGKLPSDQYSQFRDLQNGIEVFARQEEARIASPALLEAVNELAPDVFERVVARANELNREADPEAAPIGMNP